MTTETNQEAKTIRVKAQIKRYTAIAKKQKKDGLPVSAQMTMLTVESLKTHLPKEQ